MPRVLKLHIVVGQLNAKQQCSKSSDTYWIGASDIFHEADFTWTDGTKVTFEDWFEGWLQYEHFGRQPNDDGYSEQDCVELRREFAIPLKGYDIASKWYWNDISCSVKNGFVCQVPKGKMSIPIADLKYCNTTVTGSSGFVTSPNYPLFYPNKLVCSTVIVVLPGHRVFLEFENFVLENNRNCSYDFVRISDFTNNVKVVCGNYTGKEKLLTFLSETNFAEITFVSDDWVNFNGFNVSYSSKEVLYSCYDSTWFPIQGKCMKPVATPQLDWEAAFVACYNMGRKATLASIENKELQEFLVKKLAQNTQFTATSQYWLGGTDRKDEGVWKWQFTDVMVNLTYTNWFQGSGNISAQPSNIVNEDCIVMTNSLSKETPNSYYWADELCRVRSGYICQQEAQEVKSETPYPYENVIQDLYGQIASRSYQDEYLNDMYIKWVFVAQPGYQIVLLFHKFDIEKQSNCLYDYILLSDSFGEKRYCGKKTENTFQYNSRDNILNITFISDYSITFQGFSLSYEIVPECQHMLFTAIEGSIQSQVSFGRYLDNIDCFINISVPIDRRVVLEFEMFDLKFDLNCEKDFLEIFLSSEYSVRICGNKTLELWKLKYVSYASTMQIKFRTDQSEASKGFHARYAAVSLFGLLNYYSEVMPNVTSTTFTSLNYPNPFPSFTYQEIVFFAPTGFHAKLNITEFDFGRGGTTVCSTDVVMVIDYEQYGSENTLASICGGLITNLQNYSFISTYNKIGIRFISGGSEKPLNSGVMASFRITKSNEVWDPGILAPRVESTPCDSKPCKNGATCIVTEASYTCECTNEFTGIRCTEQRASYLLTEPLWSGTLAIIGLLILMLIAMKLRRHCEKTCNCGLKKDVESPFKAYEDNGPSAIYAKYADTDPTADAFSSLIQRLKSGATAQTASVVPTTQKPKLGLEVSPASLKKNKALAPKDLILLNGKVKAEDSLISNGLISGNDGNVGSCKAKNSHLLKVTVDINQTSKTASIDTNTTTNRVAGASFGLSAILISYLHDITLENVESYKRISSRVAYLNLVFCGDKRKDLLKIRVINCYGITSPNAKKDPGELDKFYRDLNEAIKVPAKYEIVIFGDMNARLGKRSFIDVESGLSVLMVKYGVGKRNNNGDELGLEHLDYDPMSLDNPITLEEVKRAVSKLKNAKTCEPDDLKNELL
ncbi:uncharacterized protein LOC117122996 [Anneissia japonica]|uniref:uncharacterized protein LOC117122996 n=1 Tax=Anneissia japonica TaxID=1529436 RepID=UPI00142567F6|nr:uncharacterized protein LOC117122996 [Anneissia japonica]